MMNQLVVFDIQSLVCTPKNGRNEKIKIRKNAMVIDLLPRSLRLGLAQSQCPSFVQRPKPPERLQPGRVQM